MAVINFNASQVDPYEGNFDPIPPDWYVMAVVESEVKPNSAQTGSLLILTYQILDGAFKGRKMFENLNVQHPNSTAVEIAYKKLSSICRATGIINLQNSEQLHNVPFKAKVKIRPAKGDYEASNEITMWKHMSEAVEISGGQAMQAPAPMNIPQQVQRQQAPHAAPYQPSAPVQANGTGQAPQPWNQPQQNQAPQPWNQPAMSAPVAQQAPQEQQPWNQQAPQQPAPVKNAAPGQAPMPPWMPPQQ